MKTVLCVSVRRQTAIERHLSIPLRRCNTLGGAGMPVAGFFDYTLKLTGKLNT